MYDIFKAILGIGVPFNMIILIVLIGCAAKTVESIAKQICQYGCHRQDVEFKRELVERGVTVDEIERIIRAQGGAGDSSRSS
jgi:hypothetical protein